MKFRFIHIPLLAASLLVLFGCVDLLSGEVEEPNRNNPSDIEGTNFQTPEISITESDVNQYGEVIVRWEGGPAAISEQLEYRYTVQGFTSDWSSTNTEFMDIFANGNHTIEIEARYASLPNENQARSDRSESINVTTAPSGPHIVLYPHQVSVSTGDDIILYGAVLDGIDLFGVNMILDYDPEAFEIVNMNFPEENLFERNQVNSEKISQLYEEDNQMEFAQVALTSPAQGIDGFGRISMVHLRVRSDAASGIYTIGVRDNSDLRNSSNESILEGFRGQQITVN